MRRNDSLSHLHRYRIQLMKGFDAPLLWSDQKSKRSSKGFARLRVSLDFFPDHGGIGLLLSMERSS